MHVPNRCRILLVLVPLNPVNRFEALETPKPSIPNYHIYSSNRIFIRTIHLSEHHAHDWEAGVKHVYVSMPRWLRAEPRGFRSIDMCAATKKNICLCLLEMTPIMQRSSSLLCICVCVHDQTKRFPSTQAVGRSMPVPKSLQGRVSEAASGRADANIRGARLCLWHVFRRPARNSSAFIKHINLCLGLEAQTFASPERPTHQHQHPP